VFVILMKGTWKQVPFIFGSASAIRRLRSTESDAEKTPMAQTLKCFFGTRSEAKGHSGIKKRKKSEPARPPRY